MVGRQAGRDKEVGRLDWPKHEVRMKGKGQIDGKIKQPTEGNSTKNKEGWDIDDFASQRRPDDHDQSELCYTTHPTNIKSNAIKKRVA